LFGVVHIYKQLREDMKKLLKLSLAATAIAALAACGGGGSSDAADSYTGNWKSSCFSYVAQSGATLYGTQVLSMTKASAAELVGTYSNFVAHSDSACKAVLGQVTSPSPSKFNLGTETTFLGAAARTMVMTFADGQARQGFITADATKMNFVITDASGARPGGWGAASPYTKQ
jgi:hypothetical protein